MLHPAMTVTAAQRQTRKVSIIFSLPCSRVLTYRIGWAALSTFSSTTQMPSCPQAAAGPRTIEPMDQLVDTPPRQLDLNLAWPNSFAGLGPAFYTELAPTPLPSPYLVGLNRRLAAELGLSAELLAGPDGVEALTGNLPLAGARPLASVYSGHQFGVWAGPAGRRPRHPAGRGATPPPARRSCSSRAAAARPTRAWATAAPCCAPASANSWAPRRCTAWASRPPAR